MTLEELEAVLKTVDVNITDVGYTVTIMARRGNGGTTHAMSAQGNSVEDALDKISLDVFYRLRMKWIPQDML